MARIRSTVCEPQPGQSTIPHCVAHSVSMHEITPSTIGHVIRSVHDMQHVVTQSCCSPSSAHCSLQMSDGMQLNAISQLV